MDFRGLITDTTLPLFTPPQFNLFYPLMCETGLKNQKFFFQHGHYDICCHQLQKESFISAHRNVPLAITVHCFKESSFKNLYFVF